MSTTARQAQDQAAREVRLTARAAGLFYLLTIAAGVYAEVFSRGVLIAGTDPASAIAASPILYRSGLFADLTMLGAYIVVTALFFGLFRRGGERLSAVAAGLSMTGIAVLAMAGLFHLVPLIAMPAPGAGSGIDAGSLATLSLRLHGAGYGISLSFFGAYCVLIGVLCIKSRRVPMVVGALMILGGMAHLLDHYVGVVAPWLADALPRPVMLLPLVGESALALWLSIFAVRVD